MKLGFYEKVLVTSSRQFSEYVGRVGVVLGISEDEFKVYGYSVFFPVSWRAWAYCRTNCKGQENSSIEACSMTTMMSCACGSRMEKARSPSTSSQ